MDTVKIIADSTCDLSDELLERYDIDESDFAYSAKFYNFVKKENVQDS